MCVERGKNNNLLYLSARTSAVVMFFSFLFDGSKYWGGGGLIISIYSKKAAGAFIIAVKRDKRTGFARGGAWLNGAPMVTKEDGWTQKILDAYVVHTAVFSRLMACSIACYQYVSRCTARSLTTMLYTQDRHYVMN